MSGYVYEKDYEIHYYEIDYKRRALITTIVDFLGDSAIIQSEELGIGIDYLKSNDLGWVLYKWNIDMYKYPGLGEKIRIRTWPCAMKKFYAYRRFEILNSGGEVLGKAESIWFLINLERKRPIKISGEIINAYGVDPDSKDIIEIDDIEKLDKAYVEKAFDVRYSDIDTNRHVNNEKYIAWAIETVPVEIVLNYNINNIKATYEKETTYGEIINVLTEIIKNEDSIICLHKILDKECKELTQIKTTWEAK